MMIKPPYLNKVLTKTGFVLCDKCNGHGQPDDKKIHAGDTYAEDPCDNCAGKKTTHRPPTRLAAGGLFFKK
jgi:DnaJ-class molecular chaperone